MANFTGLYTLIRLNRNTLPTLAGMLEQLHSANYDSATAAMVFGTIPLSDACSTLFSRCSPPEGTCVCFMDSAPVNVAYQSPVGVVQDEIDMSIG